MQQRTKKILKWVVLTPLAILTLAVVAILGIASTRPDDFSLERSIPVEAPPSAVYALVRDFKAWPRWSPWERLDPNMQRNHSGPPAGAGAAYSWKGNSDVGAGNMKISEAVPSERVVIDLEFTEPFAAKNLTTFEFRPSGQQTQVTRRMQGKNSLVAKAMGVLVNMDALIGKDFETGLRQLKAAAESDAKTK